MTKLKLPYNHNGKRPPASKQISASGRWSAQVELVLSSNTNRQWYNSNSNSNSMALIFIASLLICCSLGEVKGIRHHDSISDSSSSQVAVSNLSTRSQQQPNHRQSESASSSSSSDISKNNLNRLLVERDLSTASSKQNDELMDSSEPSTNDSNNNNDNDFVAGEGPLNGGEEPESGGDESGVVDYETSDMAAESASSPVPGDPKDADAHVRPSRHSFALSPKATTTTTTTSTTTTTRPTTEANKNADYLRARQFVANSRGGISLQQPNVATEPTTFNVNMGSDRLLIKPAKSQPTQATTTIAPSQRSSNNVVQPTTKPETQTEPRTSESVNHEFISTTGNSQQFSPTIKSIDERRQDLLLYPAHNHIGDRLTTYLPPTGPGSGPLANSQDQPDAHFTAGELMQHQPSICYTPVALILVVVMTIMTTLAVCFCTHFLFKHYARRNRFDLVASSRQFDTKHAGLSSADPAHWPAASVAYPAQQQQQQLKATSNTNNLLSGLFADRHRDRSDGRSRQRDDEFAFDNPYFREEQVRQQQQQQQQQQQLQRPADPMCVSTAADAPSGGNNEQMHFIQHHISNLHTRQVTSSVKELSSGANNNNHQALPPIETQRNYCGGDFQVVDLTSREQRNKIIADPKEGDLIAVDITGHDFIGLGFDVCGNQQEGIYVSSLLSRGPARESGCIETGDRIKSLNISFDSITLEDARDILNCGAPYKMRILLEKRAFNISSARPTKRGQKNTALAMLDSFARHETSNKQQPIRACLRKLTNLVGNRSDYETQLSQSAYLSQRQRLAASESRQAVDADWLGSAAARQHRNSPFVSQQAHLNLAFEVSQNELSPGHQHRRADTIDSACSVNLQSGRQSSIDSAGVQEILFEGRRSSAHSHGPTISERVDSSLEHFHTQNANHRLHGPGIVNRDNLHLAAMDGDTTDDDRDAKHVSDPRNRRRRRHSDDLGGHLEQTQSQPEIARQARSSIRTSSNLDQRQKFINNNSPMPGRLNIGHDGGGGGDNYDDGDDEDDDKSQSVINQHHERSMLSASVSTPTMNLLPMTEPAQGLERRMSSRRRRKELDIVRTIDEEPDKGSDLNDHHPVAAKLVEMSPSENKPQS